MSNPTSSISPVAQSTATRPTRRLAAALAGAALGAATLTSIAAAPSAQAAAPANVTVTIKVSGLDLSGRVISNRASCRANRTVLTYKRISGVNHLFYTDVTDGNGRWNNGNSGQEGKFFARVKKTASCKGDLSPFIIAPTPAASRVVIKADGVELYGAVRSTYTDCKVDRTVILVKQVGRRGGTNDKRIATDTTDSTGRWNTGNTGIEGKFYAKVRANTYCKAAASPTITARRNP